MTKDEQMFRLFVKRRLREMRQLCGKTQEEVADACGVMRTTCVAWEMVKKTNLPNSWMLKKISQEIYGIFFEDFLDEKKSSQNLINNGRRYSQMRVASIGKQEFRVFLKRRFKDMRILSGITQYSIANQLGVKRITYSSWEREQCNTLPSTYLVKIISQKIYSIPLDEFLDETVSSEKLYERYVAKG